MKKVSLIFLALLALLLGWYLSRDRGKTNYEFLFNMRHTPASKSFSPNKVFSNGQTLQIPPEGTVPRGYEAFVASYDEAKTLTDPLTADEKTLARGQKMFEVFCLPCHGTEGKGDGPVTPKFPNPPSLLAAHARELSDGEIMHIATNGRGLMPAYASQVDTQDRWKIILYIRKLQKDNPS